MKGWRLDTMTDKQISNVAHLLEETFPRTYLRKNHKELVNALMMYMYLYDEMIVRGIIKDYAENYENELTLPTIIKLAKKYTPDPGKKVVIKKNYIEDNDGCGYLWNEQTKDYECIWKYWWMETRGWSKMAVLKEHGVIDY